MSLASFPFNARHCCNLADPLTFEFVSIDLSSRTCSFLPDFFQHKFLTVIFSDVDKNGNQDSLRFPPFHQEILQQSHWDAGELHGRVRVTISEGFSRPRRSPPFERVKDIIAFSFQHAPLRKSLRFRLYLNR
jgi:hypothetical protein